MPPSSPARKPDRLDPGARLSRGGKAICCWAAAGVLVLFSLALSCEQPRPITIGFVGCLSGRLSDLGVAGRDGVILALEELNQAGGIEGHPIRLLVKDDCQDSRTAVKVDRELIEAGVRAIIGHMTSAMSMAAVPVMNQHRVLMISPTTSTNKLTGKDDFFFRVMPPNIAEVKHLARVARNRLKLTSVAVIYDLSNRAYTEGWYLNFKNAFEKEGGRISRALSFTSGRNLDFRQMVKRLLDSRPDGILMITGAADAALICQALGRLAPDLPIMSCGWAMTRRFIQNAGRAAEGVLFSHDLNPRCRRQSWLAFEKRFRKRFGYSPNFAAMFSYDAAQVLFYALAHARPGEDLRRVIVRKGTFKGVQADFTIDRYGDASRKRFLITVRNGRFVVAR